MNKTTIWLKNPTVMMSIILLVLVLVGLPLLLPKSQANQPADSSAIPVAIETLSKQQILDASSYLGEVVSDEVIRVFGEEEGRIARVLVQDGQVVRAGQPLFQLFSGQQAATVANLAATASATEKEVGILAQQIKGLQADKKGLQASLAYNQTQLDRFKALDNDQTVAPKDTEQLAATVTELTEKLTSLDASIRANQQRQQQVKTTVVAQRAAQRAATVEHGRYTVTAPFSGQIGEVIAKVGDVVNRDFLLATLTNPNTLELQVALPAEQAHKIKIGLPLRVLDSDDKVLATTSVAFKSPHVDETSQTVLVKAPLQSRLFLPLQKVKTQFVWKQLAATTVPVSAVFRMAGQPFVYIAKPVEDNNAFKATLQAVMLGGIQANRYELKTALPAHTKIITQGIQKLQEGAMVMDLATMPSADAPASVAHH
jgi:multidrug efflux pump subunit AcrA (membrane-fusion protein)